jgi:hypothetical protein
MIAYSVNNIRKAVMSKTSNFALRTFPEFKEAAQALVAVRSLYERHPGEDDVMSALALGSINDAFNTLIAKGLPAVLAIVDQDLAIRQGALEIAQDIMRFLLYHPSARRAFAANFPAGTPPHRILNEIGAANREAAENGGSVSKAGGGLSAGELEIWGDLFERSSDDQDGTSREVAADALASYQRRVEELTAAKGAIQRALATQREYGTLSPV